MKTSLRARIATWLAAIRHRRDFEQQMEEELRFHIESHTADNISDQLFAAHLLEPFGACALLVALTGLYGFLAYFVSQRTHDIGVRLALGAQRSNIQWMFLLRALAMIGAGLATGLLVSLMATRLIRRFLYGVHPNDLATLIAVAALMLAAGLLAAWLPARRASHVEPMEALREA